MVVLCVMQAKDDNAIILRKVTNTLRDSIFEQHLWKINLLYVDEYQQVSVSPMQLTYNVNIHQIIFYGQITHEKLSRRYLDK